MTDRMIMSSNGDITFMYRVGGIAIHDGRLVLVADNMFELDGQRYQEIAPYFLIEFAPDSSLLDRKGMFEGHEPGTMFQWVPLDEIEDANLFPPFLRARVQKIPQIPEYVVHSDLESPSA